MAKILLVEDDTEITESMVGWLELEKHEMDLVGTGEEALKLLASSDYDLILLDWGLPGLNGGEVFKRYRAEGGRAPVIFVTGRYDLEHMSFGPDGPDDFITKPFDMRELSARIRMRLRQPGAMVSPKITLGRIELDPEKRAACIDSRAVRLTNNEYSVLELLVRNPNRVFSPRAIMDAVRETCSESSEDTLDVCIKNLIRKMAKGGQPSFVKVVDGAGYTVETGSKE